MEAQPGSLAVFRTAHITQLFSSRLLEPFDAYSVEVREHLEHSNMELLETKSRIDGTGSPWRTHSCVPRSHCERKADFIV
jgi:hypothetical protein